MIMVEPEEQDETPPEVRAPIPTTTITLMVIDDTVRDLILAGCDAAEDGAAAEGEEPDAYYQKVRDRLAPGAEPGKVTLPNVLLTEEVISAIESYVAAEIISKDAPKVEGESVAQAPVHPHVQQSMERLGLWEKE